MNCRFVLLFIFILFLNINAYASNVVILMGASCSGKSTITKSLKEKIIKHNKKWETVDFDDVGENIDILINQINKLLKNKINVIVDTNTYVKDMEKRFKATNVVKIVIKTPLKVLLWRNEQREKKLNRNAKQAFWAKKFVIESFNNSKTWQADFYVNSCKMSLEECCTEIFNFLVCNNIIRQSKYFK